MSVDQALSRVRDYVTRRLAAGATASSIALAAGVDNKVVAMVAQPGWNPTATTLRKLESVIPANWQAGAPVPDGAEGATAAAGGGA